MGPTRIAVIFVVAVPSGWESRYHGQVLYWGPSLERTVQESRRLADLYDAHVVIEGLLSTGAAHAEQDAADTMADYYAH